MISIDHQLGSYIISISRDKFMYFVMRYLNYDSFFFILVIRVNINITEGS